MSTAAEPRATARPGVVPDPMVLKFLQYTHLEKLYGYLPGMADAVPGIFGLDPGGYAALCAGFDTAAREAAQQLAHRRRRRRSGGRSTVPAR